jgi:predicted GNAT superfamily acetyltransferase
LTILSEGASSEPKLAQADWMDLEPELLLCQVPADAQGLRHSEPQLAREWLAALRGTLARSIDAGYTVTSMTTGGCYVLRRNTP